MISKKHLLAFAALFALANAQANQRDVVMQTAIITSQGCRDTFGFYTNFHIDSGILPLEITVTNNSKTTFVSCAQNCVQHPALFNFDQLIARVRKQRLKDIFFNVRYDILRRYSKKDMPERDNDESTRAIKRKSRNAFSTYYKNHTIEPGATHTYIIFLDKNTIRVRNDQPILITLEDEQNPENKMVLQITVPREEIDLF